MGITLDGTAYANILPDEHALNEDPLGETYRGATGNLRRQDANVFDTIYDIELDCVWAEVVTLRASFKKRTPGTALLDFTDQRGLRWNPNAGTDTAYIKYGTGVYFDRLQIRSKSNTGFDETNGAFTATLTLRVNSKNAY